MNESSSHTLLCRDRRLLFCPWVSARQEALDRSMAYDYGGPEPLHALANLRLSQSRPKDAVPSAEEAFRRLRLCGECPVGADVAVADDFI